MSPKFSVYQTLTISYVGSVDADSNLTLVSQRIGKPFRVEKIVAHFALNTNRTLQLSFYLSPDEEAPTAAPPNGYNLLADVGQVDYIVGDDESKALETQAYAYTSPVWMKVYAENTDGFTHSIDVQITISYITPEV